MERHEDEEIVIEISFLRTFESLFHFSIYYIAKRTCCHLKNRVDKPLVCDKNPIALTLTVKTLQTFGLHLSKTEPSCEM